MKNKSYYFLINSLEWWWAERVVINLSNNLVKKDKKVYIITLKSTNFYDLPKGVNHISLSHTKRNFFMIFLIPFYILKLKYIIKKYHLSDWMSLLEISNFIHILSKKNATISFRIHISFFKWIIWYFYKILIKLLYPKASKIIVNSLENKYDLAEYLHINEDKIEVLYNPIDKERIKKLKQEHVPENIKKQLIWKKVFITTGRLVWQKHHEKIIYALKKIYDKVEKNRIYLIIWDWPEKKKLQHLITKLWLDNNIIFCWEQKNIFKYLNVSDLFLYASEVEWFPNVLIEAKEIWLPIISSDFKSWAKEVILWKYSKEIWKTITYPYKWDYWMLIDLNNYTNQLLSVYKEI